MRTSKILLSFAAIALAPISQVSAEGLIGLTRMGNSNYSLVTFDSASPMTTLSTTAITGLFAGDTLLGIDLRPATNSLFGISDSGRIYSISNAGVAVQTGLASPIPSGSSFGIDFNPVPDRLRVISDTDQNLRINVAGGATTVDGSIKQTAAAGGAAVFDIVGAAYTNSVAGATTTTLYALDAASNSLLTTTNPNGGEYTVVGALGVPLGINDAIGFDISGATGIAYFNRQDTLYTVNLSTGAATRLGNIGAGRVFGLTVAGAVPEASTWAMMIFGFGLAGVALRRRSAAPVSAA